MKTRTFFSLSLILVLPACSTLPLAAVDKAPLSIVERVAIALSDGDSAQSPTIKALAARTLTAFGAKPADSETPDLAQIWASQARDGAAPLVYRGRILGPAYRNGSIIPGSTTATEQLFLAGQLAHVTVSASRGALLNLAITDSKGKAVCQIMVGQPVGSCKWIPLFSERFQVTIDNNGPQNARYFLVVN